MITKITKPLTIQNLYNSVSIFKNLCDVFFLPCRLAVLCNHLCSTLETVRKCLKRKSPKLTW